MEIVITLVVSVVSNVISYLICTRLIDKNNSANTKK